MFRNHIKMALRMLLRTRVCTAMNVFGLAIGLAGVSLIAAWTLEELSCDRFHSKHGRIFRVVASDPPQNSHFGFTIIGSFSTYEASVDDARPRWFENRYYTYLLLREGSSSEALEHKLPAFVDRHLADAVDEKYHFYGFSLQPLTSIHLHSNLWNEIQANGSMNTVYVFITIGIFVLLIACINYMNLATARSLCRAKPDYRFHRRILEAEFP
jgi:hypothetical protein